MTDKSILHMTGMTSSKFGALEHYFVHLAKACKDEGYSTFIQYENSIESDEYLSALNQAGATVEITSTEQNPIIIFFNCYKLIQKIRPQIIHAHFVYNFTHLAIVICSKIFKVKTILSTFHCVPKISKKHFTRFIYNQYNMNMPVSNQVRTPLIKAGVKENITTIHRLGIFGQRERSVELRKVWLTKFHISLEATVFGCIVFDDPCKGVDLLLEAISNIKSQLQNVHFIIVGINPNESKLPEFAKELGIDHIVHWPGIVDNGWKVLNAVDVYIQPSRSEALGLAVLEAMALKLPVLCTKTGCREAVEDGISGVVVDISVQGITDGLANLISKKNKWKQMGEAGYQIYLEMYQGDQSIQLLMRKFYHIAS